jgi:hypothetical protein
MPRTEKHKLVPLTVLVSLVVSCHIWAQAPPDLVMDVTTDKSAYYLGEHVIISVQSCNVGTEPAEWTYLLGTCPLFEELAILDHQGSVVADLHPTCHWCSPGGALTTTIWAPGECRHEYSIVWEQLARTGETCQEGAAVPSGRYNAEVRWYDWPEDRSDVTPFEIGRAAPPVPISRWAAGLLATAIACVGARFLIRHSHS